jgi:hypothetical protein
MPDKEGTGFLDKVIQKSSSSELLAPPGFSGLPLNGDLGHELAPGGSGLREASEPLARAREHVVFDDLRSALEGTLYRQNPPLELS